MITNQFRIPLCHFHCSYWQNILLNFTLREKGPLVLVKTTFFSLFEINSWFPMQIVMAMHLLICFITYAHKMTLLGFLGENIWVSSIGRWSVFRLVVLHRGFSLANVHQAFQVLADILPQSFLCWLWYHSCHMNQILDPHLFAFSLLLENPLPCHQQRDYYKLEEIRPTLGEGTTRLIQKNTIGTFRKKCFWKKSEVHIFARSLWWITEFIFLICSQQNTGYWHYS